MEPTLAGLRTLTDRLIGYDNIDAVVEPTSMTWLPLTIAVERAGGTMHMVGARHSAGLRGAIVGKCKSDVIDADVLTRAGQIFELTPLTLPDPAQLALRRSVIRRAAAVIDANRSWRRLMSLAGGRFPMCGPRSPGRCRPRQRCWGVGPTYGGWPARGVHVDRRHRRAHPRCRRHRGPGRGRQDRSNGVGAFWEGHLDLDAWRSTSPSISATWPTIRPRNTIHRHSTAGGNISTATTNCCFRYLGWGRSPPHGARIPR